MNVNESITRCLMTWTKGGEAECRNLLSIPHSSPTDPVHVVTLHTAYQALLLATLRTWSSRLLLTPHALVNFIQSVFLSLPSSSVQGRSTTHDIYGEIIVDIIWSIDAHLEEVHSKAAPALPDPVVTSQESRDSSWAWPSRPLVDQDKQTLSEIVKKLLSARIINAAVCRERLDVFLLASVGLISDRSAFDKKEIRTRTGLFYKQNKFNLLREQSEGYSKLTVELTSALGSPHSSVDGRPTESFASIQERARGVWAKVMSLIGYFDLDPNRALDIILDILTVNLTTHYHFFLSLISFSPWAGSYSRPTDLKVGDSMVVDSKTDLYRGKSLDEILQIAESLTCDTKSDPSQAAVPQVLAQVLGFKFAHYQSPDIHEQLQRNLYLTAAVLIREGFITLDGLYPHLSPEDDDMEAYRKDYLDQVRQRVEGAKMSQLAMAAPLESTSSASMTRVEVSDETTKLSASKPSNQKAGLAAALLAVGALRPAIAIISKFPWVVDAHVEIADLMLRILKHSITPLYDSVFIPKERNFSFTQPRARFGANGAILPGRKPQLTLIAPTPPSTILTDFVFFFPDWIERVPLSTTYEDLVDVTEPLMSFVGLHISRDPLFVTKVTRLARSQLLMTVPIDTLTKKPLGEPDPNHPVRLFWYKLLRKYFLPALPLIRGNAVCTVEIWNVIRQYETTARWRLYGEWRSRVYTSHPELHVRQMQADRESKAILRRLSHNTIDMLSGTVAKLAHSNPCVFFTNAVNQIMAYDNLAGVVIQALRYVTNMGFDVLVFVILDSLSNPHKNRVKDDGVNISDWLQSLASFTGMLFRRYSADLSPLLKYVVHQLYNGETTDIVVLRELILKMAGIEPLPSLSDGQISAMAGGPALRIEAVASGTRGARLDPNDAILKGPHRLGKTLLETNLALPLLIQVAQQRQSCVFGAPNAYLKSLASLFDTMHGVLLQYLELLTCPAVITPEDYANKILPALADLRELYGISAPICMQIIRPMLNHTLLKTALSMQEKERAANEEAEKRLKARLAAAKRDPSSAPRLDTASGPTTPRDIHDPKLSSTESHGEDSTMDVEPEASIIPSAESPWIPELEALFDDVRKIARSNAIDVIGPGFYLTFWQLSMYDLAPPASRYDEECSALRTLSHQEDTKYINADRSSDRSKRLTAGAHRARRDRYNSYVNTLAQEFKEQTESRVFTLKRLAREKQHWFAHVEHRSAVLASAIIEHCIQPRCLLSPMDADYCAQIIRVIHTQGTPGFPTLMVYDKLLGDHVKTVIFCCSEYEAKNYGRFLLGILSDLWKWAQDEQLFLQDNKMKIGGKMVLLPGFQPRWTNKDHADIRPDDLLTWVGFKQILRKWHRKLARSLCSCIETGEFMHVYNAIIVLKEILSVFPMAAVSDYGPVIDTMVEKLVENEERGDLKILGKAYSAALKKRESQWTVSRQVIQKSNGVTASPKPVPPPLPDRSRTAHISNGLPAVTASESRRDGHATTSSTPSAPRVQTITGSSQIAQDRPSTPTNTKLAMDSVPRPEKVRRIRSDKNSLSPTPDSENRPTSKPDAMDVDSVPSVPREDKALPPPDTSSSRFGTRLSTAPSQNSLSIASDGRVPIPVPREAPKPVRLASSSGIPSPRDSSPPRQRSDEKQMTMDVMPPPTAPSQTLSAQELRETAKQTIGQQRLSEKSEERRHSSQPGSKAPSPLPRRRSSSPVTQVETRNHSQESRTSGGRSADRGDGDRGEERLSDRDLRQELRGIPRKDNGVSHRPRERTRESRESDRKRVGYDEERRHREREKRERHFYRDLEPDRDRHRRDDKDRDRESRKERDSSSRATPTGPTVAPDSRGPPTRPDPSRHRTAQPNDDALGKRRRPNDEEADRTSKRSSRKEPHRDDRNRRSDKESHDRERRRVDSELSDAQPTDKPPEKRIPDGPKNLPPTTPSAPRAMSAADPSRAGGKPELPPSRSGSEWKSQRDHGPSNYQSGPGSMQDMLPSLRSRIGEKEAPRSAPQSLTSSYRVPELPHKDDDRDNRKRNLAERDKDPGEGNLTPSGDLSAQPLKRLKITRHRYNPPVHSGLAKRTLPIDPQAGDKSRSGRKD